MAARPLLEVADIVRAHGESFRQRYAGKLTLEQLKTLSAIEQCRTAVLGGHLERCDRCDHEVPAYNSCLNRHCPKCQGRDRARWLAARCADLLPVPYFHLVFTLPSELRPLSLRNPHPVYSLLLRTAADSVLEIAADPKHLGARAGILAVLHTWTQKVEHHPHAHLIVPGGGLSPDGERWVRSRSEDFFARVEVLSRTFRRRFLRGLKKLYRDGTLRLTGPLEELEDPELFRGLINALWAKEWVVYSKKPFAGPERVLKYLARYTHRVALSNHRLVAMEGDRVSFTWRNRDEGYRREILPLEAHQFLRRFLLHVLPKGFVRIRTYGLLANRNRRQAVEKCRRVLRAPPPPAAEEVCTEPRLCPACGEGHLHRVATLPAARAAATRAGSTAGPRAPP